MSPCYMASIRRVGHDKTNMGASPPIQRAPDSRPTPMQDVGVYHRGLDVFVAQEFLYHTNVGAVFQ